MKKHIEKIIAAAAVMLLVLTAGTALQGCGDQDGGFLLGPQETSAVETYGGSIDADASTQTAPIRSCEATNSAEVVFRNTSKTTSYLLTINEQFRTILEAQSVKTLTVKAGLVKWHAVPAEPSPAPVALGEFHAKRCEKYNVDVPGSTYPRPYPNSLD